MQRRRTDRGAVAGSSVVLALTVSACGGRAHEAELAAVHQDVVASSDGALVTGRGCDALLAALRGERLAELARLENQVRINYGVANPDDGTSGTIELAPSGAPLGGVATASSPAAEAVIAAAEPASPDPAEVSGSSTTNVAPSRPDEADAVKVDGDRLYVVDPTTMVLHVLASWPASETRELAAIPLEGGQAELLVDQGIVSVFTRIYGALPGLPEPPAAAGERVYTKLTLIDTTGESPSVLRETYVEGDYLASQRHGSVVRGAVQQSPKLRLEWPVIETLGIDGEWLTGEEVEAQIDTWVRDTAASIEATSLDLLLPAVFSYANGVPVSQAPACEDVFVSAGAGLGATTLVQVDLTRPQAPLEVLTVNGSPGAVSLDADSLIIQHFVRREGLGETPRLWTRLHLFGLDCAVARYRASGTASGFVRSITEAGGLVRAATVEEVYAATGEGRYLGNAHHVVTFRVDGQDLAPLGSSPELGSNDGISTAHFTDDRAYIVTTSVGASETSELVVVDLSEPSSPQLAGRLALSSGGIGALVPAAEQRLLGISTRSPAGVAVQLFDVGDPNAPRLAAEHVYPEAPSTAATDARAITLLPERGLLALPVLSPRYAGSLEVFRYSPDALERLGSVAPELPELGLLQCLPLLGYPTDTESVATLERDPVQVAALLEQCARVRPGPFVERGSIRENSVFAIGPASVAVFALDALDAPPLQQVELR